MHTVDVTVCMMLQAWKLEQDRLKEEEMAKKSKKENTSRNKQQQQLKEEEANIKSKTLSSGKKSRAETTPSESITNTAPPVEDNLELHPTEEPFNVRAHAHTQQVNVCMRTAGQRQEMTAAFK